MTRRSRYRTTELGVEALCSRCEEWWPADQDFFYFQRGKPHSWCKACLMEWLVERGKRPGYGNKHAHRDHVRNGT